MATDNETNETNETMDSHISFLYNNISPERPNNLEENYPDTRDDIESADRLLVEIPQARRRQTSIRRPLKKIMKGFKNLVKKKSREDSEPLMPRNSTESSQWVTTESKGDTNLVFSYPDIQIL
jgi:hypothetical protein